MQIKVKDLEHIFSRRTPMEFKALNGVNATINQGEYIGIIGQTGSGKTTFIEHLNALILPWGGSIEWIFENEKKDKKTGKSEKFIDSYIVQKKQKKVKKAKDIRKRVGIVFQFAEYQLFESTIRDDIAFGPRSFGVPKTEAYERASEYLKLVGLDESYLNKSPFGLSGGQKRRVALAGILAMEPDILIADEPTAGLDPVGVREILDIFDKLHKKGKTIIIVTHDLDNVLEATKRVMIFKNGKIVKDGDTYEILRNTEFLRENNMEPPKLLDFVSKLETRGIKVPKVTSIDDLAQFLNQRMKGGV
ncbi:energy-coupling factor transporter ATPase [Mycoplasmopsis caviae]|uniref:Energy-coupling factor transporter ATP-binding protein EcfA2 n=1 Tax=Mycoplasmopsis caviae TaxID=55603 RepID=A0A3P8MDD4_9BACT|nr:energy-coupling factor transporter ATPase [Mycoplasmopsis caviae]UUD35612.1 energy-coupling factor transporter ATPase [Mycoplasmopsis caviae]VDR41630.1 ABC transporter ATP-binding protein [Mycoplasmopsis caviae]